MKDFNHVTVLLNETVQLVTETVCKFGFHKKHQIWVDCTLGGAGHTIALLDVFSSELTKEKNSDVTIEHVCCDQDSMALETAQERINAWKKNYDFLGDRLVVTLLPINFRNLPEWLRTQRQGSRLSGLIADFGVSSPQIDIAERGFSFLRAGPLDMRMNALNGPTAKELLETLDAERLQRIFIEYGEEPRARALARAIVEDRNTGQLPLSNTVEFAQYVSRVLGYHQSRVHPATRIFQALRIAVNDELSAVEELLEHMPQMMEHRSCAGIISFHSLEDRLVKRYFRAWEKGERSPEAQRLSEKQRWAEAEVGWAGALTKTQTTFGQEYPRGGLIADEEELKRNPRARSARLRGFCFEQ
jgi:16S rRNA (cytosine1402-N4)-methyltransferase